MLRHPNTAIYFIWFHCLPIFVDMCTFLIGVCEYFCPTGRKPSEPQCCSECTRLLGEQFHFCKRATSPSAASQGWVGTDMKKFLSSDRSSIFSSCVHLVHRHQLAHLGSRPSWFPWEAFLSSCSFAHLFREGGISSFPGKQWWWQTIWVSDAAIAV